jgi:hypothetical protein
MESKTTVATLIKMATISHKSNNFPAGVSVPKMML